MPTLQCGQFRVWFGTDDAPAPQGSVPRGGEQVVRVGVLPRDADLVLRIRYRRQGGTWMSLPAQSVPGTDDGPQYYEGIFRDLAPGTVIEFTVQCLHQGRLVGADDSATLTFEVEKLGRVNRNGNVALYRATAAEVTGSEPPTRVALNVAGRRENNPSTSLVEA